MAFWEQFPYTNFHEINLNWMLEQVKKNKDDILKNAKAVPQIVSRAIENLVLSQDINFYTPQMFGAVADGVTDDTAAINAAIDAASKKWGFVYFPKGTYAVAAWNDSPVLDAAIILKNGVVLIGSGAENTRIISKYGDCHVVQGLADISGAIFNMTIDGAYGTFNIDGTHCVRLLGCNGFVMSGCEIVNGQHYGFAVPVGYAARNIFISDCIFDNCGADCIDFKNSLSLNNDVHISNCSFSNFGMAGANYQAGIDYRGRGMTITNCSFKNFSRNCIAIRFRETTAEQGLGGTGCTVGGCTIDGGVADNQTGIIAYNDCSINNCTIRNIVVGVTTAGENSCVSGCVIDSAADGVRNVTGNNSFSGCSIHAKENAFRSDGGVVSVVGNTLKGTKRDVFFRNETGGTVCCNNFLNNAVLGLFSGIMANNRGRSFTIAQNVDVTSTGDKFVAFDNPWNEVVPLEKIRFTLINQNRAVKLGTPYIFNSLSASFTIIVPVEVADDSGNSVVKIVAYAE